MARFVTREIYSKSFVLIGNSFAESVRFINVNPATGPVAQKAKEEANKTSEQFANVANSRQVPDQTTATGQPLTQYHSLFFNVLSWQNPRVTGIAYATIVTFIFFTRYVPVLKYFFKATYTILGSELYRIHKIGHPLTHSSRRCGRDRWQAHL